MSRLVSGYSSERDNEVIRRILIKSDVARSKSLSDNFKVEVGVQIGDRIAVLGEWNQAEHTLPAGEKRSLTGSNDLNYKMGEDAQCVVRITKAGGPADLAGGVTIEWKYARVGGLTEGRTSRADTTIYPARAAIGRNLFASDFAGVGVEPLVATLNESGITEWTVVMPLYDAKSVQTETLEIEEDEETGNQTSASTTDVELASVAVVLPDQAGTYAVFVSADFIAEADDATAEMEYTIRDSTAAADVRTCGGAGDAFFQGAGDPMSFAIHGYKEITVDTTFQLQMNRAGGSGTITAKDRYIRVHLVKTTQVLDVKE